MPPERRQQSIEARPPHPARIAQPRRAFTRVATTQQPHAATGLRPKAPFGTVAPRPAHPATLVQPRLALRQGRPLSATPALTLQRMERRSIQGASARSVPILFFIGGLLFVMREVPETDNSLWYTHDSYIDPAAAGSDLGLRHHAINQPNWLGFHFNFPMKEGALNRCHLTIRGWNVRAKAVPYGDPSRGFPAANGVTWRFDLTRSFCGVNTAHINEPSEIRDFDLPPAIVRRLSCLHSFVNFAITCMGQSGLNLVWPSLAKALKTKYYRSETADEFTLRLRPSFDLKASGIELRFSLQSILSVFIYQSRAEKFLLAELRLASGVVSLNGAHHQAPGSIETGNNVFLALPADMLDQVGTYTQDGTLYTFRVRPQFILMFAALHGVPGFKKHV